MLCSPFPDFIGWLYASLAVLFLTKITQSPPRRLYIYSQLLNCCLTRNIYYSLIKLYFNLNITDRANKSSFTKSQVCLINNYSLDLPVDLISIIYFWQKISFIHDHYEKWLISHKQPNWSLSNYLSLRNFDTFSYFCQYHSLDETQDKDKTR